MSAAQLRRSVAPRRVAFRRLRGAPNNKLLPGPVRGKPQIMLLRVVLTLNASCFAVTSRAWRAARQQVFAVRAPQCRNHRP